MHNHDLGKLDFEAIKELVEKGEDVNEASGGETPLGIACRRGIVPNWCKHSSSSGPM